MLALELLLRIQLLRKDCSSSPRSPEVAAFLPSLALLDEPSVPTKASLQQSDYSVDQASCAPRSQISKTSPGTYCRAAALVEPFLAAAVVVLVLGLEFAASTFLPRQACSPFAVSASSKSPVANRTPLAPLPSGSSAARPRPRKDYRVPFRQNRNLAHLQIPSLAASGAPEAFEA